MEQKKFFTTKEAADQLGVSPQSIRKWIALGLIPDVWVTPGRRRLIPRASIGLMRQHMIKLGRVA
jgi:excisionase family DNA binding protein